MFRWYSIMCKHIWCNLIVNYDKHSQWSSLYTTHRYRLSVIVYRLSFIGYRLSVIVFAVKVYRLSFIGYRFCGYRLSFIVTVVGLGMRATVSTLLYVYWIYTCTVRYLSICIDSIIYITNPLGIKAVNVSSDNKMHNNNPIDNIQSWFIYWLWIDSIILMLKPEDTYRKLIRLEIIMSIE